MQNIRRSFIKRRAYSNMHIELLDNLISTIKRDIQTPYKQCIAQRMTELSTLETETSKKKKRLNTVRSDLELSNRSIFKNLQESNKIQYEMVRMEMEKKANDKDVIKIKEEIKRIKEETEKAKRWTRIVKYIYEKEKAEYNNIKNKIKAKEEEIKRLENGNKKLKSARLLVFLETEKLQKKYTSLKNYPTAVENGLQNIVTLFRNKKLLKK